MSKVKKIEIVTIACTDLAPAVSAYSQYLHYQTHYQGEVSAALAEFWRCPGLAGGRQAVLRPANGSKHYLRLVQQPAVAGRHYRAFSSYGWNAVEILVKDVDAMAHQLAENVAGSVFTVVGPPADLSFTDQIRAMQVIGPAQEALYLTEIKGAVPGLELNKADWPVEHCFVMIAGVADIAQAQRYYRRLFDLPASPVIEARVRVMSAAFGLAPAHEHPISALDLGKGYLLELDQMPPAAAPRPAAAGLLPPGIAMVSFAAPALDGFADRDLCNIDTPPYDNRRAALLQGPSGERIELVEDGTGEGKT